MGYQVWMLENETKWKGQGCATLDEAKELISAALLNGLVTLFIQDILYELKLTIKEL